MQAAIVAASRGHQVTLYEGASELGGQLTIAKLPPHKEEIGNLIDFMTRRLHETGVTVKFNITVTPEMVTTKNPDAVILASGGMPTHSGPAGGDPFKRLYGTGCSFRPTGGPKCGDYRWGDGGV